VLKAGETLVDAVKRLLNLLAKGAAAPFLAFLRLTKRLDAKKQAKKKNLSKKNKKSACVFKNPCYNITEPVSSPAQEPTRRKVPYAKHRSAKARAKKRRQPPAS
jgi:hypothetical protein